ANVREEGESGRRPCLQGVALEVLIEGEHRREVRLRERDADGMQTGRHRHLRNLLALLEALWRGGRGRFAAAVWLRDAEASAALPVEQREAVAIEQDF